MSIESKENKNLAPAEKKRESAPEKTRVINEFKEYVKKYQTEIEKGLAQGKKPESIFYDNFYNKNTDPKYNDEDPLCQKLTEKYYKSIDFTEQHLREEKEQKKYNFIIMNTGYWLACYINGGAYRQKNRARLYLNLKPEHTVNFFMQASKKLENEGLKSQIKIPTRALAKDFNRLDKMVIYFGAEQKQQILQVLDNLRAENPEVFDDTGIPRFAAELTTEKGETMTGVGFAEEPISSTQESFGIIRAKILAEIYEEAKKLGLSVYDQNFNFESFFKKACEKYQVDCQNPAFNASGGSKKFSGIKTRIKTTISKN